MDPFLIFLTVVITILTLVIVVAGIQVILILRNVNKTLSRANQTLDTAEYFIHNLTHPLNDVKELGNGVKTGLFVAEHIAQWIGDRRKSNDDS